MTLNPLKVQMSSATASLKIIGEGNNSFDVAAASIGNPKSTTVTIPHHYGTDNLLWQIGFTIAFSGGSTTTGLLTPFVSADGQTTVVATVDTTNLYITGKAQTVGADTLPYTVTYSYRILVP